MKENQMPTKEKPDKKIYKNWPNKHELFDYFIVFSGGTSFLSLELTYLGILFINYCIGWPPSPRMFSTGIFIVILILFGALGFIVSLKAIHDITSIFPRFSCLGVFIVAIAVQVPIGLLVRWTVSPKKTYATTAVIATILWTIVYIILFKEFINKRSQANQRLRNIEAAEQKKVDDTIEKALINYKLLNNKKDAVKELMALSTLEGIKKVYLAHASSMILKDEKQYKKAGWFIESILPLIQDEDRKRSCEIQLEEISKQQE